MNDDPPINPWTVPPIETEHIVVEKKPLPGLMRSQRGKTDIRAATAKKLGAVKPDAE